jgi:hypothetical protein
LIKLFSKVYGPGGNRTHDLLLTTGLFFSKEKLRYQKKLN